MQREIRVAHRIEPRELLLNRPSVTGLTLVELLVVLVILSILASLALPYAEVTLQRNKELELRRALRKVRTAIDNFHQDWKDGYISKFSDSASKDGYPTDIQVLIQGVDLAKVVTRHRYYLRRLPRNPFANQEVPVEQQWTFRSYQDEPDSQIWGEQDVYDIRNGIDKKALDGSDISEW